MTLSYDSIWPFFASLTVIVAVASTPLFAAADKPPSPRANRVLTMDGLRGFLALAVVFHHTAIYHRFVFDRVWTSPPSRFYSSLGPVGVSLFFMITGYLFWGRLIGEGGRTSWVKLYIGRLFRIGPLYFAAIAIVFMVVGERTGFTLHVELLSLTRQVIRWLSLGIIPGRDINLYTGTTLLLASVTWTLRYEWFFYLSLPIFAFAARSRRVHLPFVLTALLVCEMYLQLGRGSSFKDVVSMEVLFLLGMLCASLGQMGLMVRRLPDPAASTLVLVLLAIAVRSPTPSLSLLPQMALGVVFYLIVSGCSIFGLLLTRPALRLGDISYGIYLLQGLALAAVFRVPFARTRELTSAIDHWLLSLGAMLLLIAGAMLAHVWIERPGIAAGKRLGALLRSRLAFRSESLTSRGEGARGTVGRIRG